MTSGCHQRTKACSDDLRVLRSQWPSRPSSLIPLAEPDLWAWRIATGLGRSLGWWPNDAIAFIRRHQPAGKVMNLSWYTGNALIFELFPKVEIFVDPRFEAYPRNFLLDAINAPSDPALFDRLAAEHDPGWLVLESRDASTRKLAARLSAEERFTPIYADTVWLILVDPKQKPATRAEVCDRFEDSPADEPRREESAHPQVQEEAWQVYLRDFIAQ